MRKIDAFAHVLPRTYRDRLERHLLSSLRQDLLDYYRAGVFDFDPVLTDIEARRRQMEAYGDYAQVLILAVPPVEEIGPPAVAAQFARLANDEMAELVARHPDLFVGFAAALPLNDVEAALVEVDRAASDLGALGFQLFSNVNGVPLDHPSIEPLLGRVEGTGKMVWLHPTRNADWADYPTESSSDYGLWWSLGWPYETAAALSRLVYSGSMERHPDLRLIAHHGAGMVPHFGSRLAMGPGYRQVKDELERPPLDYFRRFYADTALFGATPAVRSVLEFFGPDHVLFGTDTPLGGPEVVGTTISDLEASGLARKDLEAVFAGNATRLLGVT